MKKNIMMRTASGLLIAVMLTSSIISGTLAKYTTTGGASDSARVAKFGVTISGNGDNVFKPEYDTDNGTPYDYTGALSVKSSTDDDVVAPGTSGSLAAFTVSGTPEVAVAVAYEADLDIGDDWVVDGTFYCPIAITVGTNTISGLNYTSVADFEAAVEAAIVGAGGSYAPNTNIADETQNISWAWAYEGATGSAQTQTDALDTALGNQATGTDYGTISLDVTVTVTQID